MPETLDDLDALRTIVEALVAFERPDQERILRWTREKLGLAPEAVGSTPPGSSPGAAGASITPPAPPPTSKDIKSFIAAKKPATDNQFAAAVAYFYRFEAAEHERKTAITGADLQEAARLASRPRLSRPSDTLQKALKAGVLDKGSERGAYVINTVGENLVAMTLPHSDGDAQLPTRRTARKRKAKAGPAKKTKGVKKAARRKK